MWNNLNLKCPIEDLCHYDLQEASILQELPTLVNLLKTSSEVLTNDHPIWEEIQVFHNVREKYRRILHSDKCLLLLQRVGTCLRKIVILNISKTYLDLAVCFQESLQSSPIYLPSCQQLEYVLLRTVSAAKLICELLRFSKEAFCYIIQKLRMGHLILNLMMATSVTARVNVLFRDILVQIFDIYKKLYIWREKLKKGVTQWPKPLDLPEDLEAWLNPEASDLLKPKEVSKDQVAFLSRFFEKQKDDTVQLELDSVNDDECVIIEEANQLQLENPDVGEVIPRPKKRKEEFPRKIKIQLLEKIQNVDSLRKLFTFWQGLQVGQEALMKKILTPIKRASIKRILYAAKKKLKKLNCEVLPADVKEEVKSAILEFTRNSLSEHLGLIEAESESSSVLSVEKLKPVKKFKELRLLYNIIHQMLQSTQKSKECAELVTKFKLRRADIKRLIKNGESKIAKELIYITSKEFLTYYKKLSETSASAASSSTVQAVDELKIAKTVEEFKILYNTLCQIFESTQQYEKLTTLKKKFISKLEVIMHFVNNNNKKMARKLIVRASKEFLERNFFRK